MFQALSLGTGRDVGQTNFIAPQRRCQSRCRTCRERSTLITQNERHPANVRSSIFCNRFLYQRFPVLRHTERLVSLRLKSDFCNYMFGPSVS